MCRRGVPLLYIYSLKQGKRQLFSIRSLRVRECSLHFSRLRSTYRALDQHVQRAREFMLTRAGRADRVSLPEAYLLHAYGCGVSMSLCCSQPAYRPI
jgi:hypothetical protein